VIDPVKLMTVVGARPQFIKAAAVSRAMAQPRFSRRITETIVHTGQHYDDSMSDIFFRELGIPAPSHNLGVGSGPHGAQTGAIMDRLERIVEQQRPEIVLVYGDTNSTLAGALVAAKAGIRLAHVEAGLRSFRRSMPEEINRVVTDRLSDDLFCPTPLARTNLEREGIVDGVQLVGDIMFDGFQFERTRIAAGSTLAALQLEHKAFVLVTLHRAENTDDPKLLAHVIDELSALSVDIPVVFPVHPRTRAALERMGAWPLKRLRCIAPQPYRSMVSLTLAAKAVATDSGGLQKEAYFAGTACVTLRDETEWLETLDTGWNRLAPPGRSHIASEVRSAIAETKDKPQPRLYGDGTAAEQILEALLR
jgi:UDP-GlcNAc3NAcA epimerase